MCILPNIILPKPIQYFKAKINFFVFLLYLKHFSFFFFNFSFPVFLLLVASFTTWAFPRRVPVSGGVVQEHLVHAFERFGEIVLQGRERGANGRGAEAVRDEAEVREAALDSGLQDGAGPAVPDRRPVLGQQIRKFFTELLGGQQHILSGMQVTGVRVLPVQILRNSFGRKLCFADVSKIPS